MLDEVERDGRSVEDGYDFAGANAGILHGAGRGVSVDGIGAKDADGGAVGGIGNEPRVVAFEDDIPGGAGALGEGPGADELGVAAAGGIATGIAVVAIGIAAAGEEERDGKGQKNHAEEPGEFCHFCFWV